MPLVLDGVHEQAHVSYQVWYIRITRSPRRYTSVATAGVAAAAAAVIGIFNRGTDYARASPYAYFDCTGRSGTRHA